MNQDSVPLIEDFLGAYSAERPSCLESWLDSQLARFPEIWTDHSLRLADARALIAHMELLNANKAALYAHTGNGGSLESFLQQKIHESADMSRQTPRDVAAHYLHVYEDAIGDAEISIGSAAPQSNAMSLRDIRWDNEVARLNATRQLKEQIGSFASLSALIRQLFRPRDAKSTMREDPDPSLKQNRDLATYLSAPVSDTSHLGVQVAVAAALMVSERLNTCAVRKSP